MNKELVIKIKDSVDLFLNDNTYLTAFFMNTRKRKSFRVDSNFISLIGCIDGVSTVGEICQKMERENNIASNVTCEIIELLVSQKIATPVIVNQTILPEEDVCRYTRQINYFSEFLGSEEAGLLAQKKVKESVVLIFGCGAIGGNIAVQLAMAGVEHFILYDYDKVCSSDASRHLFYTEHSVGEIKISALSTRLKEINKKIKVEEYTELMLPQSNINDIIKAATFVVNTLDEPYIGYTSSKISRICVQEHIPHFIAGGFDAHLASTGELIIPYVTPCVECYTGYFKETLKDWKPKPHPVKSRYMEIGGLSSMSLFSSSFASIEILKYIAGLVDYDITFKTRGELLFGNLGLTYLDIKKDPECAICGGEHNES